MQGIQVGRASFSSATFTVKSTDDAEIQDPADGSSRIRADNRYFSAISQQLWQGQRGREDLQSSRWHLRHHRHARHHAWKHTAERPS